MDKARSSEMHGTGLGLAIAKHILLQHDGRIWAESVFGKGSVFHFALPLYTPHRLILRLSSGQQSLIMWINCVCGFNIAFLVFDEEIL